VVSISTVGYNTFDRIINFDTFGSESKDAVLSRFKYWEEAYEIAISLPLFGIGLGNYFDHSQIMKTSSVFIDNPHNYFMSVLVDTGFIGLLFFCLLIGYFIYSDTRSLKLNSSLQKTFIVSFWSLFIFSLLNPQDFYYFYFLFWLFRGVIYKLDISELSI
jgi:O-antigen ligase